MERRLRATREGRSLWHTKRRLCFAACAFGAIAIVVPSGLAMAGTNPPTPIAANNAVAGFGNSASGHLWNAAPNPNPLPAPPPPASFSVTVTLITYNRLTKVVKNPCTVATMKKATMISAGADFGMALIAHGIVCVWGDNYWGEEAQGDSVTSHLGGKNPTGTLGPVPVCLPESWSLATGPNTGYGYCNDSGAVLSGATSISAGGAFALVLFGKGSQIPADATVTPGIPASRLPSGSVAAWGANYSGELGNPNWSANTGAPPYACANGNSNCAVAPVAVGGGACASSTSPYLSSVSRISAGNNFALAETPSLNGTTGGRVCSWGDNTDGQLGLGGSSNANPTGDSPNYCSYAGGTTSNYCSWTPQPVQSVCDGQASTSGGPGPLSDVYDISAGGGLGLALLTDGHVCSWGDNAHGELGVNTVAGPNTCTNNVTSSTSSCALSAQEVLAGKCPNGGSPYLGSVFQISAGAFDALALIGSVPWAGGSVCSWGDASGGGLGNGQNVTDSLVPAPVWGIGGFGYIGTATCISAGSGHDLAVVGPPSAPGTLVSWGDDPATGTGQNGASGPSLWPVHVPSAVGGPPVKGVTSISASLAEWNLLTHGTKGCMLPPPRP